MLTFEVLDQPDQVAREGAARIAACAREAVALRGRFALAVSGGHTPWLMLRYLAGEEVPWKAVWLLQVDERVAPAGHAERNLTHLEESLLSRVPLDRARVSAMPVESADLDAAAREYAARLAEATGGSGTLDLVHLGLGADGHTASLVPGDAVLERVHRDVAMTVGTYQGRRRMTLTFPAIDRARQVLWIVTGPGKAPALVRLLAGDPGIPAGRVERERASILADFQAAVL